MKRKWLVYKKINQYLKFNKLILFLYFLLNVGLLGLEYFQPRIYQKFIDEVLLERKLNQMKSIIFLYMVYFVLKLILGYAKEFAGFRMNAGTIKRIKEKIFSNLFHREFAYYDTHKSGDIQVKIEKDTEALKNFFDSCVVNYFINFISLLLAIILCMRLSPELTCIAAVSIPITILADKAMAKKEKQIIDEMRNCNEEKATWLNSVLLNWREVKALNIEKTIINKYVRFLHTHIVLNAKEMYCFVVRCLIIPWVKEKFFMQIMIYFAGGLLVIAGRMRVSEVLIFIVYYGMLSKAITAISTTNAEFEIRSGMIDRVIAELDYVETAKGELQEKDDRIIEFKKVSFHYVDDSQRVLSDVGFTINRGDRVAICGKSGSGKTTVARLMAGFYEPTEGSIYYAGNNLKEVSRESLYQKIGYIRQDSVLFNASIRDNLLIANPEASDEMIDNACKKALVFEYIQGLPEKYATIIDERGENLSGGLKQRLILARQFLKDSEVYILDEVTSNLDRRSEKMINEILNNMEDDKTIIYIAHHHVEREHFNRIIHVEEGRVSEV